jgi:hypothetical protein
LPLSVPTLRRTNCPSHPISCPIVLPDTNREDVLVKSFNHQTQFVTSTPSKPNLTFGTVKDAGKK